MIKEDNLGDTVYLALHEVGSLHPHGSRELQSIYKDPELGFGLLT